MIKNAKHTIVTVLPTRLVEAMDSESCKPKFRGMLAATYLGLVGLAREAAEDENQQVQAGSRFAAHCIGEWYDRDPAGISTRELERVYSFLAEHNLIRMEQGHHRHSHTVRAWSIVPCDRPATPAKRGRGRPKKSQLLTPGQIITLHANGYSVVEINSTKPRKTTGKFLRKVGIDFDAAFDLITNREELYSPSWGRLKNEPYGEIGSAKWVNDINALLTLRKATLDGKLSYTQNDDPERSNRLYCAANRMSSRLRQFLTVDGRRIAELDLSAAGLAILCEKVLSPEARTELIPMVVDGSRTYHTSSGSWIENMDAMDFYDTFSYILHRSMKAVKNARKGIGKKLDMSAEQARVLHIFYRSFWTGSNALPNPEGQRRQAIKLLVQWWLNIPKAGTDQKAYAALDIAMAVVCPRVHKEINALRSGKGARLSVLIQRHETELVWGTARELDLPYDLVPIHDGLGVPADDAALHDRIATRILEKLGCPIASIKLKTPDVALRTWRTPCAPDTLPSLNAETSVGYILSRLEYDTNFMAEKTRAEVCEAEQERITVTAMDELAVLREKFLAYGTEKPCLRTPWPDLDIRLGGGLPRGQLTLFAASTGAGKTVAACQLAVMAASDGLNVLYMSSECKRMEALRRMYAAATGTDYNKLTFGRAYNATLDEFCQGIKSRFTFNEHNGLHNQVGNTISAYVDDNGVAPDLVIYDYISPSYTQKPSTWASEMNALSKALANIASQHGCPVFATAQAGEGREWWLDERTNPQPLQNCHTMEQFAGSVVHCSLIRSGSVNERTQLFNVTKGAHPGRIKIRQEFEYQRFVDHP